MFRRRYTQKVPTLPPQSNASPGPDMGLLGTHIRIPWFETPIDYDVRAKPRQIPSLEATNCRGRARCEGGSWSLDVRIDSAQTRVLITVDSAGEVDH